MKLNLWISLALASTAILTMAGCSGTRGPAGNLADSVDEMQARIDELHAQVQIHDQQLGGRQAIEVAPVSEAPSGIKLRPIEVKEVRRAPKRKKTISKRERLRRLAARKRSAAKAIPKRKSSRRKSAKKKSHLRVPGVTVRELQVKLKDAGFDPGKIDGKMGKKTIAAIVAYQREQGLKEDGIVGRATWRRLAAHTEAVAP